MRELIMRAMHERSSMTQNIYHKQTCISCCFGSLNHIQHFAFVVTETRQAEPIPNIRSK
uniref:Uncharacterized protein n=1 Tax=Arundo donax TaxID=35708 RepID=A0A0A8ZC45_ARUDO